MLKKSKLLFILPLALLMSCTTINLQRKIMPPTKSYTKILHTVEILSCTQTFEPMCPKGEYMSTGSGLVVNLVKDETIVITAGHVCYSKVEEKMISEHRQSVSVIDHNGTEHQAHVIKSTLDNGKGGVDMCALWVPTLKEKGIDFSMFEPKVGQEVYYIGSPSGIFHPPVAPILVGIYSGALDASNAMITAPAVGGSSGSVVMDLNNKMVGVLWAAHPEFHHATIITNWLATAIFLDQVIKSFNKN